MTSPAELIGLLRSLLVYYGVLPFRARRLKRFYAQFIRPGDLCFDIGSHAGSRIWTWLRLGAQVVAVEPQPLFQRLLQRWYGRRPDVVLVEAALGSEPGWATLHISRQTPTVTTLSPEWITSVRQSPGFARVRWDDQQRVPVLTLDDLIEQHGEPAFCKIDVEGYEPEVLAGLSRPLPGLSFEYIPAAAGQALACIERLEVLGVYEYNRTAGENLRFLTNGWNDAVQTTRWLKSLAPGSPSGDIYARLART